MQKEKRNGQRLSAWFWRAFLIMVSIVTVLPSLGKAEDVGVTKTTIPTLLPIDNASIGGDSRYCTGLVQMIQTGNIHLWNLPCFVKFFSETLIAFAGTLSVLFVIFGGFKYTVAGFTEEKEQARKTIEHALIGLVVCLMAWVIVDIALQITTE